MLHNTNYSTHIEFALCGCNNESDDLFYKEYELPASNNELELKIEEEKLTIINDNSTFRDIFYDYPNAQTIDFKKHTLLLVKEVSPKGIEEILKSITKIDGEKYAFKIIVKMNLASVLEPWCVAYIIPKTNEAEILFSFEYV